jgi:hypothetical protein
MTEEELRAIVREAIERHLHGGAPGAPGSAARETAPAERAAAGVSGGASSPRLGVVPGTVSHASHLMFVFAAEADGDGRCLIEPAVACTHCGYCTSYGH